jgi:DNA-binding response OmpR family regulator
MAQLLLVSEFQEHRTWLEQTLSDHRVVYTPHMKNSDFEKNLKCDVVFMHVDSPEHPNLNAIKDIRNNNSINKNVPILVFSPKNDCSIRLRCLENLADSFMVVPVDPQELSLYVQYAIKRHPVAQEEDLVFGDLVLNKKKKKVFVQKADSQIPVFFTQKEFEILCVLVMNCGEVVGRQMIRESVWPKEVNVMDRAVDAHLVKIKRKLVHSDCQIVTVYSEGYCFATKEMLPGLLDGPNTSKSKKDVGDPHS